MVLTYQESIANIFTTLTNISYSIVGLVFVWVLIILVMFFVIKFKQAIDAKRNKEFDDLDEEEEEEMMDE